MFEKIFKKDKIAIDEMQLQSNDRKSIALCDASSIIHSRDELMKLKHIYLPRVHYNNVLNVANGKYVHYLSDDFQEQLESEKRAIETLEIIRKNENWCNIVPNLDEMNYFVDIEHFTPKYKNRVIISLACLYVRSGYDVTIYTRTKNIRDCASLQPNVKVVFLAENNTAEE